jgi:hypothetical protein
MKTAAQIFPDEVAELRQLAADYKAMQRCDRPVGSPAARAARAGRCAIRVLRCSDAGARLGGYGATHPRVGALAAVAFASISRPASVIRKRDKSNTRP